MSTKLKLRGTARFLASIFAGVGTLVRKDGLATYIDIDFTQFAQLTSFNPTSESVLVQSSIDGSFARVTLAAILTASQTVQVITVGSTVNVAATDGLIIINKTSGSATAVNLPASTVKIGKVKIVDFKGDAGTNNITVNCIGSDTFNGGGTSWIIEGAGGSIVCDPISGTGYAV